MYTVYTFYRYSTTSIQFSNFEFIHFDLYGMAVVDMRSRYDTSALLATGDVTSMMTTTATQAMVKVMLTTPTAIRMRQYLSSSVLLSHHDDDRLNWPRPRRRTEDGWRLRVDLDLELPDRVDLDLLLPLFGPGLSLFVDCCCFAFWSSSLLPAG